MIAEIRQRINQLRQQPEHIRLRTAFILSAGLGTALAVISLAVLLPLQLYFMRAESDQITAEAPSPQAHVGGLLDVAPTPSPFLLTPTFSP